MNKKRIVWASAGGAILVVIFGILPWFFGNMAHKKLEEQAVVVSKLPGYTLTIQEYDQGWFSSRAVFNLGFDEHMLEVFEKSENKDNMDRTIMELFRHGMVFETDIAHGPVTFQDGINFALLTSKSNLQDFDTESFRIFKENSRIEYLLQGFSRVTYFGTIEGTFSSPAFSSRFTNPKGQEIVIDFGGFEGETTMEADLSYYDLEAVMPGVTISSQDGSFTIWTIRMEAEAERLNDYLWLGEGETSMKSVEFSAPGKAPFNLDKLKITYDMKKESDKDLSFALAFTIDKIAGKESAEATDEIIIEDIELDTVAHRLEIGALTEYVKGVQEVSSLMYQTTSPEEQKAQAEALAQVIGSAGQKLLLNSPELEIKALDFKFNGGSFDGDGVAKINAEGLTDAQALAVPEELTRRLDLDLTARFDQPLAEALVLMGMKKQMAASGMDMSALPPEQVKEAVGVQTSMMLQVYVQQGLIVAGEKENTFKSRIQIKDGQQMVNGKAIQLPMAQ
ncbi:YdgA family protein [Emcibacter sp.]|uniref:YdgA family protein n=1 Tax=Emcibacter sp. TaxID=1979954 RepID=UPI003A94246F